MSGKWLDKNMHTAVASIALATNQKEFDKLIKPLGIYDKEWMPDNSGGFTHQLISNQGDFCHIVCINKKAHKGDKQAVLGTLVHESAHVFRLHCELIGEDSPSPEFEAYGIQHIFIKLLNDLY